MRPAPLAKGKKGKIAKMLGDYFADPEKKTYRFSDEQIARFKAWTPEHVGFGS